MPDVMYDSYIMKLTSLLEENQPNLRTQITLTTPLKRVLEAKKRLLGESLSEYLRKAAVLRLLAEDEENRDLKVLAESFTRSRPWKKQHLSWKRKEAVRNWQKKLRAEWQ